MAPSLHNSRGLTLIEVLIALAILSISLTAMMKATSQNIKDTAYLDDKMTAHWVGLKILNEARVGFFYLPAQSEKRSEEVTALNQTWLIDASSTITPNPRISEITVVVYRKSNHATLANLTGYRYD